MLTNKSCFALFSYDTAQRLDKISRTFGMEISIEKIKLIVIAKDPTKTTTSIKVGGILLQQVNHFKYLGCTFNENGKTTDEERIPLAIGYAALKR